MTAWHDSQATDGLPPPRRYRAIVSVALGTALAVLDGAIVAVGLPTIARDLGVAPSSAVLVVTVYQLVLVMTLLPFSALGTRVGLRRQYQCGQIVFLVASALCFFAGSLPLLLAARALQALGAAAALSVSSALIRSIYPVRRLGRGMAVSNVVASSANALAPTLGGVLLSVASWSWLFAAAAPFGLLSLWLGHGSLPEPERQRAPYDARGALLCALMFGLIILGLSSAVHGESVPFSLALVLTGLVVAAVYVKRELTTQAPILPVDLLAKPVMALSVMGAFAAFTAQMTLFLSLPFRLQALGFGPRDLGLALTPWPCAMMVVGPMAAALSDRVSPARLGGAGMAIVLASLLSLAFLPAMPTSLDVAWRMAVCGAGYGLFLPPNARLIMATAPILRAASAGALIVTTRLSGQTIGATLVAALLALGIGNGRVPALVAAGLALVAGVCSFARTNALRSHSVTP